MMSDQPPRDQTPLREPVESIYNTSDEIQSPTAIFNSDFKTADRLSSLLKISDGAPPPGRQLVSSNGTSAKIVSIAEPRDAIRILSEPPQGAKEMKAVGLIRESLGEAGDDQPEEVEDGVMVGGVQNPTPGGGVYSEARARASLDILPDFSVFQKAMETKH